MASLERDDDDVDKRQQNLRETAIFDLVVDYLHSRELYEAAELLKSQRTKVVTDEEAESHKVGGRRSNQHEKGRYKPSLLESLIEKSYVTEYVSPLERSHSNSTVSLSGYVYYCCMYSYLY